MITIKEVAQQAGVSPSTVSRVLTGSVPVNEETKQKVLQAVKELHYQPNPLAQGLKGGRIKTIGIIIPNVRNLVFPAAIRGIEDTANRNGYTVVLCNTDEDVEKELFYIDSLRRRLIDGFIFSTARLGQQHHRQLKAEKFPFVFLIRHNDEANDAVVLDNFSGAYQATKYLAERGMKKIAIINGSLEILLYRQRYAGYQRALAEIGLVEDPGLVIHEISGWEESYRAMTGLLAKQAKPDAVFATNDPKAIGIIRAINDHGLQVPEDISVIGFDNSDIAAMIAPPLTTVAQPFYEMGVRACEKLIALIEGKRRSKSKIEVFPAELVIRKSVK